MAALQTTIDELPVAAATTGAENLILSQQGKTVRMPVALLNVGGAVASKGAATPTTDPAAGGAAVQGTFYFTSQAGTYTNFKDSTATPISVAANDGLVMLAYDGTAWTKIKFSIDLTDYLEKDEIFKENKNLANPANIQNAYVNSTYGISSNAAWRLISCAVSANTIYTISGWNSIQTEIRYENAAGGLISGAKLTKTGGVVTITTPANCVKIYFTIRNGSEADTVYSQLQIELGSSATSYEPYGTTTVIQKTLIPDLDYVKTTDFNVETENVAGKNLADPAGIMPGKYINTSGAISSSANFTAIKITIEPGVKYTISGWQILLNKDIRYEDAAGNLISHDTKPSASQYTFTSPAGCVAIYFTIDNPYASEPDNPYAALQLEKGDTATSYEAFGTQTLIQRISNKKISATYLEDGATLNGKQIATVDQIPEPTPQTNSINKAITVIKSGNDVYVRTKFNSTTDLIQHNLISNSSDNNSFDLVDVRLMDNTKDDTITNYSTAPALQSLNDDTAPINTYAEGHIMEGHGLSCPQVTVAHDKTSADLLSLWQDTSGKQFYLIKIIDANNLLFYCKPYTDTSGLKVVASITGNLSHVSGATHTTDISTTTQTLVQQYPVTLNNVNKMFIDSVQIVSDGTYKGDEVKFVTEYDVSDQTALIIQTPFTFNSGPSFLRISASYTYQANGACVVRHTANFKRSRYINYWYVVQAGAPGLPTGYPKRFTYIPKVADVGGVNYKNIVETTTLPPQITYTSLNVESSANPPDRQINFFATSAGAKNIGFALGYNTEIGAAKPSVRGAQAEYWQVASTGKAYPRIIARLTVNGDIVEVLSYRCFFDNTVNANPTCVYSYKVGDSTYLYIDYHKNVTKDSVSIPAELTGKSMTVVEKTDSFTLHNQDVAPANGLLVSVTGAYGYAVIKFQ